MSTFVLVHGGWHGGWCWRKVTPLLRAGGHDVYTPTLDGQGDRVHLANPTIDLAANTRDISALLEYEDLRDVVLVGHSSSGAVIAAAADVVGERLRRLVYLDAFVPQVGESVFDLIPPPRREFFEQRARDYGQGWSVPLDWDSALSGWSITDPADLEWMRPRLTAQPLALLTQARAGGGVVATVPSTYLQCQPNPAAATFLPFAERAKAAPETWTVRTLDTGHDAMITAPDELAELLTEAAN